MSSVEVLPRIEADAAAAAITAFAPVMSQRGATLYAELCHQMADDPDIVDIVSQGLASSTVMQLFCCVQYLLSRDPGDPLAQYYASFTDNPAPAAGAFPDFARFCRTHRDEIVHLMNTRTVQVTTVERCKLIMPPLSRIASLAGEPLDLIEIGCSAGVLLTFDKYAYEIQGRGRLGAADAPLTLSLDVRGGPAPHLPKIGRRVGLDLRLIDLKSEDEKRWLLAQSLPEMVAWRTQLASALDVVAGAGIDFFEGDALDLLPGLIPQSPGPLCVFHSACLLYWSEEAKARLHAQLLEASRGREFYRLANERGASPDAPELTITHYRDGAVGENGFLARSSRDFGSVTWIN